MRKILKSKLEKILLGPTTPKAIADGFSLGTAIAILPTFGFGILLGAFLSFLFPKINRPALFSALAVWNPLTQIPIYAASYWIGDKLLGRAPVIEFDIEILNQVYTLTMRLLIGNIILTLTLTAISYFVVYYISRKYIQTV